MSKPFSSLTPSVDLRLAAWEQNQFQMSHPAGPKIRPTITLSRQCGCEAFPLAEQLKTRLEEASGEAWNIFDKSLVEKVAHDESISVRLLSNLGDITHLLETLGLHPSTHITQDEAFEKVAKAILQIAAAGNAIIVGRGSAILCKALNNSFHFRLEAGYDWRVASIMERLELSREEAEEQVKSNTKLRDRFISQCLGANVADVAHYHAVFNNERCPVPDAAAAICAYVKSAWPSKGYFKH